MLGVVVPCFNEADSILRLVEEFEETRKGLDFSVIFVDDGSTDKTGSVLKELSRKRSWLFVVKHERNLGLAQSLKDGINFALNREYDYIAQMDADLTHSPQLLPWMMGVINGADLVIASRYISGGGMSKVPWWRVALSKFGNSAFRLLLRIDTLDATSGFRLGKRRVYESVFLEEDSFGIQLELTVKAERQGLRIKEIPFILSSRERGTSKFRLKYLLGYPLLVLKLMR